jgi:hypothetical protein
LAISVMTEKHNRVEVRVESRFIVARTVHLFWAAAANAESAYRGLPGPNARCTE